MPIKRKTEDFRSRHISADDARAGCDDVPRRSGFCNVLGGQRSRHTRVVLDELDRLRHRWREIKTALEAAGS